jgi:hypothetical protein
MRRMNMNSSAMTTAERMEYANYLNDIEISRQYMEMMVSNQRMLASLMDEQRHIREHYFEVNDRIRSFITRRQQPRESVHIMFGNDVPNTLLNLFSQLGENVVVRPTDDQIAYSTEVIEYHDVSGNPNTSCPITMSDFAEGETVMRIKHCGHMFKEEALRRWFTGNVKCPMCRYDIRDDALNQAFENM